MLHNFAVAQFRKKVMAIGSHNTVGIPDAPTKKKKQGKHKTRSNGTKDHNTLHTTPVLKCLEKRNKCNTNVGCTCKASAQCLTQLGLSFTQKVL